MRVAVTGATGNVGTRVVQRLLADDAVTDIVGIASRLPDASRLSEPGAGKPGGQDRSGQQPRLRHVRVDLGAPDAATRLRTALAGMDAVIHLAWLLQPSRDIALMERVNIGGLRALLDAIPAVGVTALVHASSLGAYSPAPKTPAVTEDAPTDGVASSPYSRQKARANGCWTSSSCGHRGFGSPGSAPPWCCSGRPAPNRPDTSSAA